MKILNTLFVIALSILFALYYFTANMESYTLKKDNETLKKQNYSLQQEVSRLETQALSDFYNREKWFIERMEKVEKTTFCAK